MEKTLYFARRLKDGSVLRISVSRATAWRLVLGMLQPVLLVLAAALLLSGLLAGRLSKTHRGAAQSSGPGAPAGQRALMRSFLRCSTASTGSTKKFSSSCASCASSTDEFNQIIGNMQEGLVLLDEKETRAEHQRCGHEALRRGRKLRGAETS